jgi:hypothetical protein
MTKEQMRDQLHDAVMDFGRAIRNESLFEYEASRLVDTLLEIVDTKETRRWRCGPVPG